jgi:hypothetical protein
MNAFERVQIVPPMSQKVNVSTDAKAIAAQEFSDALPCGPLGHECDGGSPSYRCPNHGGAADDECAVERAARETYEEAIGSINLCGSVKPIGRILNESELEMVWHDVIGFARKDAETYDPTKPDELSINDYATVAIAFAVTHRVSVTEIPKAQVKYLFFEYLTSFTAQTVMR